MENLDAMDLDDLQSFINANQADSRLIEYAKLSRDARLARERGAISYAIRTETRADRIYAGLPPELRW